MPPKPATGGAPQKVVKEVDTSWIKPSNWEIFLFFVINQFVSIKMIKYGWN